MAQRERSAAAPRRADNLGALRNQLRTLVEPVVSAAGLDLEDLGVSRAGRRHVVRITVDGEDGVGHDELTDVSHRLSAALDDAEATAGELPVDSYTLEVSSPGVDRPLTQPRHWRRNIGRLIAVTAGERQVTGRLVEADETGIVLELAGERHGWRYPDLGPGRVQIEFGRVDELAELDGPDDDEEDEE